MSAVAEGIEVMSEVARLSLHDQEIELHGASLYR